MILIQAVLLLLFLMFNTVLVFVKTYQKLLLFHKFIRNGKL